MKPTFSPDPNIEQSLRHSVRDGVAYSVMSGAGETYFAAYAIFLGATAAQVSLLAALPPLFGAIAQFFAAWLETRAGTRRAIICAAAFMHALTWFPIIWMPYFFPEQAIPVMVSCIVLYYGWMGLGAPLWCSLMGDLVPSRKRGRFFGGRTQLMSVSSFIALILGGLVLQFFEMHDNARLGFVLIFTIAAIARFYSTYHLACMLEPQSTSARTTPPQLTVLSYSPLSNSRFMQFSAFIAATNFAVSVAGPFFTVYMLKDLNFSYLEFTVATAVTVMAQFLTLRMWGRLADIFGNRVILTVTGLLIPLVPALWLVSHNFAWVLFIQALAGWSWAGFGLAAGNYLYDIVPAHRRPGYWATHNFFNSIGVCAGALLGGALSDMFPHNFELLGHTFHWSSGLWGLMICSALLRTFVMTTFLPKIEEPRPVRAFSARAFVFRMIRFNALAGFILDRLGMGRRRTRSGRIARPDSYRA